MERICGAKTGWVVIFCYLIFLAWAGCMTTLLDQYCAIGCAGWDLFGFDVFRRGIALHVKLVAFRVYGA